MTAQPSAGPAPVDKYGTPLPWRVETTPPQGEPHLEYTRRSAEHVVERLLELALTGPEDTRAQIMFIDVTNVITGHHERIWPALSDATAAMATGLVIAPDTIAL